MKWTTQNIYHNNFTFSEVCTIQCLNGGRCYRRNQCVCPAEYTGYYCQTPVCSPPCQNQGVCVRPGTCYCPYGYFGSFCERGWYEMSRFLWFAICRSMPFRNTQTPDNKLSFLQFFYFHSTWFLCLILLISRVLEYICLYIKPELTKPYFASLQVEVGVVLFCWFLITAMCFRRCRFLCQLSYKRC